MFYPKLPTQSAGAAKGDDTGKSTSGANKGKEEPGSDITGRFDPRALERGAAALRELDSSPNAKMAFDVTKLQEMTKQKELSKQQEELALNRSQFEAQRTRAEGEERRKSISHREEQERISAQYKAQLDAEAYQKKLEDQQKQNESWLQQQHQQFLRQEEVRKRNERELAELRREEMREEKTLQQQLEQARIHQEYKEKMKQERDNIDIHLRSMRAKSAEERTTKLEQIKAVTGSVGSAFNALVGDKAKLYTTGGFLVAVGAGLY
eukprot:Selendium_serpulae@DN11682_c0_g1_i1.p1